MVDGLDGLRHDAVVRSDHQDRDVRDLGAPRAQSRERLVTGRVEEGEAAPAVVHLVRADVLRDAARLRLDHGALADRIEQRGLAVVDVTHDRDHGRPRLEIVRIVLVDLGLQLFLARVLDRHLALELARDELDRLVSERLRDRDHLADAHHDLDDLAGGNAERGGEILDRGAGGDRDGPGRLNRGLRLARPLGLPRRRRADAGPAAAAARR